MAEVSVIMTPQEAKLWRAQQKIIRQTQELEAGYKKVGKAGQGAAKETEAATKRQAAAGNQLTSSITRMVTGYVSLQGAIQLAAGAFTFMKQEADAAMQSATALTNVRRKLVQISTSEGDLKNLERLADEMSSKYGVSRETTRQILFTARDEGFSDFARELVASSRVVAPEAAMKVAADVPGLFPGAGISAVQAVNAVLATGRNFEDTSAALSDAAAAIEVSGGTPSEAIALAGVLSQEFKSAKQTGTYLKSLGESFAKDKGLAGMGIVAGVRQLQAMAAPEREAFLGTAPGMNQAFSIIADNIDRIQQTQMAVQSAIRTAGTGQSPLAAARARAGVIFGPQQAAEAAAIGREVTNERILGAGAFARQRAYDSAMETLQRNNAGVVPRYAASGAGYLVGGLRASPESVESTTLQVGRAAEWSTPALLMKAAQVMTDLRTAALEQLGAAKALQSGGYSAAQRAKAAVPAE